MLENRLSRPSYDGLCNLDNTDINIVKYLTSARVINSTDFNAHVTLGLHKSLLCGPCVTIRANVLYEFDRVIKRVFVNRKIIKDCFYVAILLVM